MSGEKDAEFVERLVMAWAGHCAQIYEGDLPRLFAIARRGAAIENHGQDAKPSEETTPAGGQR